MYCSTCGTEIVAASSFCNACGTPTRVGVVPRRIGAGPIVVLILGALGLLWGFFMSRDVMNPTAAIVAMTELTPLFPVICGLGVSCQLVGNIGLVVGALLVLVGNDRGRPIVVWSSYGMLVSTLVLSVALILAVRASPSWPQLTGEVRGAVLGGIIGGVIGGAIQIGLVLWLIARDRRHVKTMSALTVFLIFVLAASARAEDPAAKICHSRSLAVRVS